MKHTILSSHFCLFQNSLIDLLTSKGSCFITKKYKVLFYKKKEERFLNYKPIFLKSKDVLLSVVIFNLTCVIDLSSFHNGLKNLYSLKLLSILTATLWKVVMKCKIVIFFNFLDSFSQNFHFWCCNVLTKISPSIKYPINLIFSVVVYICTIHFLIG